jgi:hypothetical protein
MALRYTAAFARRDPIGLVTVNRTSGPGARPQRFLPRPALSSGATGSARTCRSGVGVEEELLLADRRSLALAPVTERVLTTAPSSAAHLKGEQARRCPSNMPPARRPAATQRADRRDISSAGVA